MVFSSTVFLFIFFPMVFILNFAMPNIKLKNIMLTFFSILFYAYGEPFAVLLLLISITLNYIFAIFIVKYEKNKKTFLTICVLLNLGLLGLFKYTDFTISILNNVLNLNIPQANIALPIGISFFTFQALSYVIDVYKDKKLIQKNWGNLILYVSLFPQLIAGPIIKYYDVAEQINDRKITLDKTALGFQRFIFGLSKKLLIANTMGNVADYIFSLENSKINISLAWLGALTYVLQIYFDFSGYSDMAIGLGKIFGFEFKENFNFPYISDSMQVFWRRWHISVSTWFKEYLYIPLGGNRKGVLRTNINKLIVFFCTGLWHGASLNFVVWGLLHGLFLTLESYNIIPVQKIKFKPICHLYTLAVITLTFVIFRADNLSQGFYFIKQMFIGFNENPEANSIFLSYMSPLFIITFLLGIIFSMPIKDYVSKKLSKNKPQYINTFYYASSVVLLFLCIINLSASTHNPFIYFRF